MIFMNSQDFLSVPENATATYLLLDTLFKFVTTNYLTEPLDATLIGVFDEFLNRSFDIKSTLFQNNNSPGGVDDENETFAFFAETGNTEFKRWLGIDLHRQNAPPNQNYPQWGALGHYFTTHLMLLDRFRQTYLNPTLIPQTYFISQFSGDYSPRFSMKTIELKLKPYLLVCCFTAFLLHNCISGIALLYLE